MIRFLNIFFLTAICCCSVFSQPVPLQIDIAKTPFSMRGSYIAVKDRKEGITIADMRAMSDIWGFLRIEFPDAVNNYRISATPYELKLQRNNSCIRISFENPSVLRIRGEHTGIKLFAEKEVELLPVDNHRWRMFQGWYERYFIDAIKGNCTLDYSQTKTSLQLNPVYSNLSYNVQTDSSGYCEMAVEIFKSEWTPKVYNKSFDDCVQQQKKQYNDWANRFTIYPQQYSSMANQSAYLFWANTVSQEGILTRESIYMSKNWMCNIWSWDHCFNALALADIHPRLAWDQLMVVFDNQNELGALPDMINEFRATWGFLKVPIHGLILKKMMEKKGAVSTKNLEEIYIPLKRWTNFWFKYRDDDRDGIPQLNHSNEAADGATPFDEGLPIESPDLAAYLVVQMDVLAEIATRLNKKTDAAEWQKRSASLLTIILKKMWIGQTFITTKNGITGQEVKNNSYNQYMPLVLGKKLPENIRDILVKRLLSSGMITPVGFASESTSSSKFDADSYWRGTIWAPLNYLLIQGLKNCGENTLANDLAERFCKNIAQHGLYEHFNPLTGEGKGDPSYSWTAAVYLELVKQIAVK